MTGVSHLDSIERVQTPRMVLERLRLTHLDEVSTLLRERRSNLDSLVSGLLEHETLDEADAYAAAGLPRNQLTQNGTPLALNPGSSGSGAEDGRGD